MLERKRVLIVDDDPGMSETLTDILEDFGYDVAVANSGERAVAMMTGCLFDAALMDIRMPGMNGVEAFKKIKETCPAWKVLMMTAYSDGELVREAVKHGVAGVFRKPLNIEALLEWLGRITTRSSNAGRLC